MRFVVRLHSFACTLPSSSTSSSPTRPYLRLNFDGYKKFSTKPLPSALTAASAALVFAEAFTFQYETAYPQKLHQKQLTIKLFTHNSILADSLIGRAAVTLHTVATGPIVHELPLTLKGAAVGSVRLTVEMEQLVSMSLHLQSVQLSSLPTIQGKAPVSHLTYGYTGLDSKRYKTDKQLNTVTPEWSAAQLHPIRFHTATVKELWREGVELDVMVKKRKGEKSHKCGSVLIRLASHHSFKEREGLSVVERLQPTPDYAQLQCMVRLHFHYEGVASYVQMSKGRHDAKGIHDGQPFAEGLPLPAAQFYKSPVQYQPPPASSAIPPPIPAGLAQRVQPVSALAGRRASGPLSGTVARERERSVMSIRAAREYDGASVVRSSYNYASEEEEEEVDEPRARQPPRAASVLGMADNTASASARSKGLSRSSSSGSLASSATNSRPRTPNSQRRYLAYPPLAPIGGPPGGAVGGRAVSFDSQARELTPASPRGRDSSVSSPTRPSATPASPAPGVTGYCAMCGRPSNNFCNETFQPVCSQPCTAKALLAAGLPVPLLDEEKQRPPPLNPSVYPLLSPSSSHRQPGPAGFCVVCSHPALYLCKDTLVPVCSAECKLVHLKLNPHLSKGRGAAAAPEPSAPAAQSRQVSQGASGHASSSSSSAVAAATASTQPSCVVCGRRADFRCSVSNDSVCSVECKQLNLSNSARRARSPLTRSRSSTPTPPAPAAYAVPGLSCPACTFLNSRGAAVCEMCGGALSSGGGAASGSGAVSPRTPVYHQQIRNAPDAPSIPKRPSLGAVHGASGHGGPRGS